MYRKRLGGKARFKRMIFAGNEYNVVDPTEFITKMLTFKLEYYPKNWVKLFIIIIVGSMGSGKTTIINAITNYIFSVYKDQLNAFKCSDLIYALESGVTLSYFQEIIIDDAMIRGFDARQSMTSENIDMSQNFSIGRHTAVKTMGKGVLFVIFAIQSPSRLDKFIRENADLVIYKTYYPNLEKVLAEFPEELQYVKDFTKDAMLENELCQLSACLGIDRIGRPIRFFFPEQECKIQIPIIEKKPDDYGPLLDKLRRFYIDDFSDKVIKAYMFHWAKTNNINISQTKIQELYYQIIYEYNFGQDGSDAPAKPKIDFNVVLIENEILGIKWDDLARKYDQPRTTLYDNAMRYKNRLLLNANS